MRQEPFQPPDIPQRLGELIRPGHGVDLPAQAGAFMMYTLQALVHLAQCGLTLAVQPRWQRQHAAFLGRDFITEILDIPG